MTTRGRHVKSAAIGGLTAVAALVVVTPLLLVFGFLLYQGRPR